MSSRELKVEVPAETAELLQQWSKETGKSLSELMATAFTLLKYAVDKDTKLIKEDDEGKRTQLAV